MANSEVKQVHNKQKARNLRVLNEMQAEAMKLI